MYKRIIFSGLMALALSACNDDSSSNSKTEVDSEQPVWLWAFDDDASSVSVYAPAGDLSASFTAAAFSKMHLMQAGPSEEPTLWMGKSGSIYAFTAGFHDHGDHSHMETPETYAQLTLGSSSVHMGQSSSGDTVAFADDAAQSVYIIDVAQKKRVQTITHGSGHSAALIAEGYAITTAATGSGENWLNIVDIAKDSVLDSLTIGAGAHGDAYYAEGKKAFIACAGAFYVVDLAKRAVVDSIPYVQSGRTNFVYHAHENIHAVGLHKPVSPDTTSDKFMLLDMSKSALAWVTIDGAALNWHITNGQFALAGSGDVAIFADVVKKKIYHVNLLTRKVTTLDAPAAGVAVATNYAGDKVWALSGTSVKLIDVASGDVEKTFTVAAGTDWIYVSSVDGDVEAE